MKPLSGRVVLVLLFSTVLFLPPSCLAATLKTNFKKAIVPLQELRPGGPPPDGIPAIDHPKFVSVKEASKWLNDQEPVLAFSLGESVRAYPLQVLIWHEIVNDVVGGIPVVVTFCPLCNSALVFERRLSGEVYDFGTSGMLYFSDLVMYDRQTHSLWAQMEGRAIVGDLAGAELKALPAAIVAWGDWKRAFPKGQVLSRETGYRRTYGRNPYVGYDRVDQPPFLYQGPLDGRLLPMERVVALSIGGQQRAYPYRVLKERMVVADTVGGKTVVVFYRSGTASALDRDTIADSRDVGATGVFSPFIQGRRLTFIFRDGFFVDRETGSHWNILGQAVAGKLKGKTLERLPAVDTFWFAWAAFKPKTAIYGIE